MLSNIIASQAVHEAYGGVVPELASRAHQQNIIPVVAEAIKRAVESGLGIGCISRLALRDAFRRGSLVPLETPQLDLSRQFWFIWHKQKYQTAAMREFLELCSSFTAGVTRSDQINLPSIA